MPLPHIRITDDVPAPLVDGLNRLRAELQIPDDFPPDVLAAAHQAAGRQVDASAYQDFTRVPFVTIDPVGSMDLDQAMFLERLGDASTPAGYRVWYAIADVAFWVHPGDPIDLEAHRRGQTMYAPNAKASLHPEELSEGAASLLADGTARPALVWRIELDQDAATTSASVVRGLVKSTARLDYAGVQQQLDAGTASEPLRLLREVGQKLQQREADRGGVSLNLPEQEVSVEGDTWTLHFRQPLPVEGWNAEISLLTGIAAAGMMLTAGVGILRTLPPAEPASIDKLRHIARGLRIDWPAEMAYPEFVRSLDTTRPTHLAMMTACTTLFRGAGYTVITPGMDPASVVHAALAADYAHCTAPLRRLIDRYAGECCLAITAGTPVPQWVLDALPALPQQMQESDHRAKKFERGVVDLVEALILQGRVGEVFDGVVIELQDGRPDAGTLQVANPAVQGLVKGHNLPLGGDVQATLTKADVTAGVIAFQVGDATSPDAAAGQS